MLNVSVRPQPAAVAAVSRFLALRGEQIAAGSKPAMGCLCRKLNSTIIVVKAIHDRHRCDAAIQR